MSRVDLAQGRLGASADGGTTTFRVWAPHVERVEVKLHPGAKGESLFPLEKDALGYHVGETEDAGEGDRYYLRLDGDRDRADPGSSWQPEGVHGPSAVFDPSRFAWTDAEWTGQARETLVFYAVHVGTFLPDGDLPALTEALPYLVELGVNALQLMPIAEFPGKRNWGYDGVFPFAVSSVYGGPETLQRLVDRAHELGLSVFLDAVYNHIGPEGNYLSEFGPYFNDRHTTPWGPALNYDGPDSDPVREYVLESVLRWMRDFHVDGLRLDAVHGVFDFGARHVLAELSEAVDALVAERGHPFHLIAESDLNATRVIRPREVGGWGLDAQWNDDFHHAQHAAVTGDTKGYFSDFGSIQDLIKAIREGFVYDGRRSGVRRRRHGESSRDLEPTRFVVFTQNHDQIGNAGHGQRDATQLEPWQLRVQTMLLLLGPNLPLLFMGQEYAEQAPFEFFCDFENRGLSDAVREGRVREARFFGGRDPNPDPFDEATFEACRIDLERRRHEPYARTWHLHHTLLALRSANVGLQGAAPGSYDVEGDDTARWIRLLRRNGSERWLLLCNLGDETCTIPVDTGGEWSRVLWCEDPAFGGDPGLGAPPERWVPGPAGLELPRWSAVLYRSGSK